MIKDNVLCVMLEAGSSYCLPSTEKAVSAPLSRLRLKKERDSVLKLLRSTGIDSASLGSLAVAGRCDNPIPNRFLAPIDCSKILAQRSEPEFVLPAYIAWRAGMTTL